MGSPKKGKAKNSKPEEKEATKRSTRRKKTEDPPVNEVIVDSVGTNETHNEETIDRLTARVKKLNEKLTEEQDKNMTLEMNFSDQTRRIKFLTIELENSKEVYETSRKNWKDEINKQEAGATASYSSSHAKRSSEGILKVSNKKVKINSNTEPGPATTSAIKQHVERKVFVKGKEVGSKPIDIVRIKSDGIYKLIKECKPNSAITESKLYQINGLSVQSTIVKAMIIANLNLKDRLSDESKETICKCDMNYRNYVDEDKAKLKGMFMGIKSAINSEMKKAVAPPIIETEIKMNNLAFLDVDNEQDEEDDKEGNIDGASNSDKLEDELAKGQSSLFSDLNKSSKSDDNTSKSLEAVGLGNQESTKEKGEVDDKESSIQAAINQVDESGIPEASGEGIDDVAKEPVDLQQFL